MKDAAEEPIMHITDKLQAWLNSFIENLPNIAVALLVMVITYFLSGLIYKLAYKICKSKVSQDSIAKLIARAISIVVVLAGLFLAIGALNLGEVLTGLLTGAGISGLVIGLALQGTLSNTVSGIILSLRENIRIGDWIETNGYSGEIKDIKINYIVIRSADNNTVIIPNKEILESPFKNYTLTSDIRISLECGVGYESNLEDVEKITKQAINNMLKDYSTNKDVEFYYKEFGGSSINFMTRFWVDGKKGMDKLKAKSKAVMAIKNAFDAEGINIPFPIRTLQFDNEMTINNSTSSTAESK